MSRRSIVAAAIGIFAVLLAFVFGRIRTEDSVDAELEPVELGQPTATVVERVLERSITASCVVGAPADENAAFAGTSGGIVTAVPVNVGDEIGTGAVLAVVQDMPILAIEMPFPLYRTLERGVTGRDVAAVQSALGLEVAEQGTFDAATADAVTALYKRAGIEPQRNDAEIDTAIAAAKAEAQGVTDPARLDELQAQVDRATARRGPILTPNSVVVLPRGGRVTQVLVTVGQNLAPMEPLVAVAGQGASIRCVAPPSSDPPPVGSSGTVAIGPTTIDVLVGAPDPAAEAGTSFVVSPSTALPEQLVPGAAGELSVVVESTVDPVVAVPIGAVAQGRDGGLDVVLADPGPEEDEIVEFMPGLAADGFVEVADLTRGDIESGTRLLLRNR